MIKKILLLLLAVVLIAGGIVYYKIQVSNRGKAAPADFLPENVLVYFNHKNLDGFFDGFINSPIGQTLDSIDFVKIALDIDVPIQHVEKLRKLRDILAQSTTQFFLTELLSKGFAVALLPDYSTATTDQFFKKNLLFISQPKHGPTLMEFASSTFGRQFEIVSSQYGAYIIYRIQLEKDMALSFVKAGPFVLAAMDEIALRDALDRRDGKGENLHDNFLFSTLQQKYNTADAFCFFSVDHIQRQIDELLHNDQAGTTGTSTPLVTWNGFTSGAYGAWQKKLSVEDSLTLYFDRDRLDTHTAHFLDTKPQRDKWLSHVPADVLLYYWTNTLQLPVLWEMYVNDRLRRNMTTIDFEETVKKFTGRPIAELIPLVGDRMGLMIKEPSSLDLLPLPHITFVVELHDVKTMKNLLKNTLIRSEVAHNTLSYEGKELTFWGEQAQTGLQPVYTFHDKALYISSSIAILKEVIDTITTGDGLAADNEFQISAPALLLKNNSIGFVQFASMLEVTKEIIRWGGTMMAIQNRDVAYKSKIVIDNIILPLLDSMKMYSTITSRSYNDDGVLIIESQKAISP